MDRFGPESRLLLVLAILVMVDRVGCIREQDEIWSKEGLEGILQRMMAEQTRKLEELIRIVEVGFALGNYRWQQRKKRCSHSLLPPHNTTQVVRQL